MILDDEPLAAAVLELAGAIRFSAEVQRDIHGLGRIDTAPPAECGCDEATGNLCLEHALSPIGRPS